MATAQGEQVVALNGPAAVCGGQEEGETMISMREAARWLLICFGALAVFHIMVLAGALPSSIVWGGPGKHSGDVALLESVALVVTLLFGLVVAARASFIGPRPPRTFILAAMWVVVAYLALNVAGNLTSTSAFERAVFAPFSILMVLLALRVAVARTTNDELAGE
jgi:hypothetical protein